MTYQIFSPNYEEDLITRRHVRAVDLVQTNIDRLNAFKANLLGYYDTNEC